MVEVAIRVRRITEERELENLALGLRSAVSTGTILLFLLKK